MYIAGRDRLPFFCTIPMSCPWLRARNHMTGLFLERPPLFCVIPRVSPRQFGCPETRHQLEAVERLTQVSPTAPSGTSTDTTTDTRPPDESASAAAYIQ